MESPHPHLVFHVVKVIYSGEASAPLRAYFPNGQYVPIDPKRSSLEKGICLAVEDQLSTVGDRISATFTNDPGGTS